MDSLACNYNAAAGCASACTYAAPGLNCAGACLNGGVAVVYTPGSYANENGFTITDCSGAVLASMSSGTVGFNNPCVVLPAVYSVNLTDSYGDGWNLGTLSVNGVTYSILDVNGNPTNNVFTTYPGGYATSYQVGACVTVVYGCTDPIACNYNAAATTDDGTCTYADLVIC